MLFWTATVSLESLLCVECVVLLMKLKLRGGNWILPAVSALPAWRKNKHAYWEQWTFLQILGDRFFAPFPSSLFFYRQKVFGAQGCLNLIIMFGCLAWGIRAEMVSMVCHLHLEFKVPSKILSLSASALCGPSQHPPPTLIFLQQF